MRRLFISLSCLAGLSGCGSIDKERATEQRKSELCSEIATQHLSHCAGNHVPPPPPHPDADIPNPEN